ncbi:MAG: cyanophycinase [Acidobacteriota bacterium]
MNRFFKFRKININAFGLTSLILILFVSQSFAQEHLVIVGGCERPTAAMSKFVEWAGKENAHILIIPWATAEPEESFKSFKETFEPFHPKEIELAPIAPLTNETKSAFLNQLKNATGVFFTGGDQVKVMDVLKDETLLQALKKRYKDGIVFGGTSAGTAIMSDKMITGEGDFTIIDGKKVETVKGLGLLPDDVIVDQHFIKRQRQNRLFGLILQNPSKFGVGIDEGTALVILDNRYGEVVGTSQVMVVNSSKKNGALNIFLLKPGEWLDLRKHAPGKKRF